MNVVLGSPDDIITRIWSIHISLFRLCLATSWSATFDLLGNFLLREPLFVYASATISRNNLLLDRVLRAGSIIVRVRHFEQTISWYSSRKIHVKRFSVKSCSGVKTQSPRRFQGSEMLSSNLWLSLVPFHSCLQYSCVRLAVSNGNWTEWSATQGPLPDSSDMAENLTGSWDSSALTQTP